MKKLVSVLLLFSLSACASAGYEAHQGKAAKLDPGSQCEFEGNTVRYADKELVIEASFLSHAQTDLYFSLYKGGKHGNPFPAGYFVFQISLENRGKKNAVYNPGMTYLVPRKGRPSPPKDFTSFYAALQLARADDADERTAAFKETVFDTSVTVRPGERTQGLIVFSLERNDQDSAVLILNDICVGSETRTVPLQFRGVLSGGRP